MVPSAMGLGMGMVGADKVSLQLLLKCKTAGTTACFQSFPGALQASRTALVSGLGLGGPLGCGPNPLSLASLLLFPSGDSLSISLCSSAWDSEATQQPINPAHSPLALGAERL